MTVNSTSGGVSKPLRIHFHTHMVQKVDVLRENIARNEEVPLLEKVSPHARPLAVCGGGPSLLDTLSVLKEWSGDIWAINRTGTWLRGHGIASTFITIDANLGDDCTPEHPEDPALFASWCRPELIEKWPEARMFHMEPLVPGGFVGGTTTAVSVPAIALHAGYTDVTFFGCESSFVGYDHADRHEGSDSWLLVEAGGRQYMTQPPLYIQAQELSRIITTFGEFFHECSGGLLRAMIRDPDWGVVGMSPALGQHMKEVEQFGLESIKEQFQEYVL